MLDQEPSDTRAIEGIQRAFLAEAEAALPALRAYATAPAGLDGVKDVVGRRFALFKQPERTEGEWVAWWADYAATLADLPKSALEAGMQAWVKLPDAEFLPKPGQLRELALKTPNRAARGLERAEAALRSAPALAAPLEAKERPAPEEVKAWMEDFRSKIVRPEVRPPPPPAPVPVDEHGVSAAMRAHQFGGEA